MLCSTKNSIHDKNNKDNDSTSDLAAYHRNDRRNYEDRNKKISELLQKHHKYAFLFFFGNGIFAVFLTAFGHLSVSQTICSVRAKLTDYFFSILIKVIHILFLRFFKYERVLIRRHKKGFYCSLTRKFISRCNKSLAKAYALSARQLCCGCGDANTRLSVGKLLPFTFNIISLFIKIVKKYHFRFL